MKPMPAPRLFGSLRPLDKSRIPADILAGVTLAAMNIPQALGYTRIAGTPVVTGLYTLLLPLIAFAAFGSSRYLVVAADSATAAILAGGLAGMAAIESPQYVSLAALAALMTGAGLLLARLLKLGFLADFLSQTVLAGFLTGVGLQVSIAVLGQILGLNIHAHGTLAQLSQVVRSLPELHPQVLAISAAVVVCILACRRFVPKLPGPLFVVVAAVAASAAYDFAGHGIAILGPVSGGLPALGLPHLSLRDMGSMVPMVGSCIVMIVAQSAATARAYAVRHRQILDENADLVGLAAANIGAAFSGTFVVDGSPTQTAMVERSGGQSQVAHLSTAAVVAIVLLFLTGPLKYLPQCVLGAIVFTIAIGLVDVRGLRGIRRESPGEFALAVFTAATVVVVGVEQGILMAMTLSLLRIVNHTYRPHTAVMVKDQKGEWHACPAVPGTVTEPGVIVYRFSAPLFYANANRFSEEIPALVACAQPPVRWVIVDGGPVTHIDYTAARTVHRLLEDLTESGVCLAFAHVGADLRADLDRHHLTEAIGTDHLFDTLREALAAVHNAAPPKP